jgi:hypothetical protein
MNCVYITLFFKIVAGIVQILIKSWNQLLYPRVIEVCRLPLEPRHDFFLKLNIVDELFPSDSRHHFVTFCRFTTLPQTATICLCICAGRSPLALRNHMTERTSHLAEVWIGAANSNTSHSKKTSSKTVNGARLTVKGSRSTAVLPQ